MIALDIRSANGFTRVGFRSTQYDSMATVSVLKKPRQWELEMKPGKRPQPTTRTTRGGLGDFDDVGVNSAEYFRSMTKYGCKLEIV